MWCHGCAGDMLALALRTGPRRSARSISSGSSRHSTSFRTFKGRSRTFKDSSRTYKDSLTAYKDSLRT